MTTRIQLRRDTAVRWASVNPVLAAGEPAVESDTGKVKVGDGTSAWSALPYILDVSDLTPVIQDLLADLIPASYTDEQVRDVIGATISGDGDFIAVTASDASNTIRVEPGAALSEAVTTVQGLVDNDGLVVDEKLPARLSDVELRAAYVPKWKPDTAYTAGEAVVAPSGQLVTANAAFTSGATYVAGNWTATGLSASQIVADPAVRAAYGTEVGDPQRAELDDTYAPIARGFLQGSGAPSNTVGVNGQMYWDSTNKTIYGPKAAGAWPAGNPLLGESISLQASLRGDTIPQPGYMPMSAGQRATAAGRAFFIRYVPARSRAITLASFITAVAATVDDPAEVGLYTAGTTLTRVATTGQIAGKLNATGVKTAPLTYTADPGTVYYAAVATATVGGTASQLSGATFQTADSALMYGSSQPSALAGFADGALSSGLLPATIAASSITWGSLTVYPALTFREV